MTNFWLKKRHAQQTCPKGHLIPPYQEYDPSWKMLRWRKQDRCITCELPELLEKFFSDKKFLESIVVHKSPVMEFLEKRKTSYKGHPLRIWSDED